MAVTKIWKIEKRLDVVIDYTVNEKKTNGANYLELHNVLEYAKADYKTEKQLYVTAINCNEDRVFEEMIQTKKVFEKEDGILGFHAFQSFCEGEVTPQIAHAIRSKTCRRIMGR